jgi:predicted RNA-binding Zn-ribbon protein involved in translation (DUF1610 family)
MAKRKKPNPIKKIPRATRHIAMMVISEPEPNTRSVLVYTGEGTVVMRGPGNVVMDCGNCGAPLIEGVPVANLQGIVFRCPNCGQFNDTLA